MLVGMVEDEKALDVVGPHTFWSIEGIIMGMYIDNQLQAHGIRV
jgi:hypothetical protein